MKKIFSRILAVGLLSAGIIGVSSCDYLDQKPENLKTTDMIWETRVEAEAYLYNIYGYIWLSTDDPVVFGFADETSCVFSNTNVRNMVEGNWGPSNTLGDNKWSAAYRGIQKALVFEQNIDRVPEGVLSTDLKTQYKAESRSIGICCVCMDRLLFSRNLPSKTKISIIMFAVHLTNVWSMSVA